MILQCTPKVYKDPWFGRQELYVDGGANSWNHDDPSFGDYVDVSAYVVEGGFEYRFTMSLDLHCSPPKWSALGAWHKGPTMRAKNDGEDPFDYELEEKDWSYNLRQFAEGLLSFCRSIPLKEAHHV